ncbi:MAG: hypothetical protein HZB39_06165 [Planctomycetes bacterium]|nr:hypothetical protein [Planctomycetota bacterium]
MRTAIGFKAHSGWASLVVIGIANGSPRILERRRVELVDSADGSWAKQPYHAAEGLDPRKARSTVQRVVDTARQFAVAEMRAALERAAAAGHRIVGCAVLVGEPMPNWTLEEIVAVHVRMHRAEGALFRDALLHAAEECGIVTIPIVEKRLAEHSRDVLGPTTVEVIASIASAGRALGPPWGKDQKDAALAAWIALHTT